MPMTRSQSRAQLHVCLGLTGDEAGTRSFNLMAVSATQAERLDPTEEGIKAMEETCNMQRPRHPDEPSCEETDFYESNKGELDAVLSQQSWLQGPDEEPAIKRQRAASQEQFEAWVQGIAEANDIDSDQVITHDSPESMGRQLAMLKSADWTLSQDMPSRFELSLETALKPCLSCTRDSEALVRHPIDDKVLTDLDASMVVMVAFPHSGLSANGERTHALQCVILSRSDRNGETIEDMSSALDAFSLQRPQVHDAMAKRSLTKRLAQETTESERRDVLTALSWQIEPFSTLEVTEGSKTGRPPLLDGPQLGSGYMASEEDVVRLLHHCSANPSMWLTASSLPGGQTPSTASFNTFGYQLNVSPASLPECQ